MRALQKLFHTGSITAVTIPRTMLRSLAWVAGDRLIEERTADNTILLRRPTEADVIKFQQPTRDDIERFALLRLSRNGNATCITIKRDFLIRLGWLSGQSIIVEILEGSVVRLRVGSVDDIIALFGSTRIVEQPGAVR